MTMKSTPLRGFGWMMGAVIAGLFGLLLPWWRDWNLPVWPWIAAGLFWAMALVRPAGLAPVYRAWMAFGHVMGWVNTRIILSLVFFLIVTPVGLLWRVTGHDPLRRRWEPRLQTYRNPRATPPQPQDLERPF